MRHRLFALLLAVAVLLAPAAASGQIGPSATCGLTSPAFCDALGTAYPTAERPGQLDPVVWGASRINIEAPGGLRDAWVPSGRAVCGQAPPLVPGADLAICDGALAETVADGGANASISWYPRQPFDFAGRTGTVTFDVTDDTNGGHFAWPNFQITSTPAPAPHPEISSDPTQDLPQTSFGFDLSDVCGSSCSGTNLPPSSIYDPNNCVTVQAFWTTTDYVLRQFAPTYDGCVMRSDGGAFNTFRVQISQTKVVVLGTDAGTTETPRPIAELDNADLPLTRGLVWLQDAHYNAGKECPAGSPPTCSQADHTFRWRNVGFDGPVLARDLGVEYPDALTAGTTAEGTPIVNLGYAVSGAPGKDFTFSGVTGVERASGALLVYNFDPEWHTPTVAYRVNGGAPGTYPFPITGAAANQDGSWVAGYFQQGVISLPLSQLTDGTDTINVQASSDITMANVDLILVGAGGQPPTPTPTATTAPVATPTPTQFDATATGNGQTFALSCSEVGMDTASIRCTGK